MGNKVRFGLEQVHIAFSSGNGTWEEPIAIPGVVNFSATPEGGESVFYADNAKYYVRYSNNGYTGELEMALIPDTILAEMLGWEIDHNGMLVEDAEGVAKEFALMAQVQGDARNRRFVYYRCTANRPGQSNSTTTENTTPTTETLSLTMLPIEVGNKKIVKGVIELDEMNASIYNSFFEQVTMPDAEPLVVDKSVLNATISLAETLDQLDYTPESWTAFSTVLTAAQGVAADTKATQSGVNQATAALREAIIALEAGGA